MCLMGQAEAWRVGVVSAAKEAMGGQQAQEVLAGTVETVGIA